MAGIVQHLRECRNDADVAPDLEMLGRISFQHAGTSAIEASGPTPHFSHQLQSEFLQIPFRVSGLVAPASRRQFCAAAGVEKIAGGTPALPNPNLDDEARDHRTDPSNRREKPRLKVT